MGMESERELKKRFSSLLKWLFGLKLLTQGHALVSVFC